MARFIHLSGQVCAAVQQVLLYPALTVAGEQVGQVRGIKAPGDAQFVVILGFHPRAQHGEGAFAQGEGPARLGGYGGDVLGFDLFQDLFKGAGGGQRGFVKVRQQHLLDRKGFQHIGHGADMVGVGMGHNQQINGLHPGGLQIVDQFLVVGGVRRVDQDESAALLDQGGVRLAHIQKAQRGGLAGGGAGRRAGGGRDRGDGCGDGGRTIKDGQPLPGRGTAHIVVDPEDGRQSGGQADQGTDQVIQRRLLLRRFAAGAAGRFSFCHGLLSFRRALAGTSRGIRSSRWVSFSALTTRAALRGS